MKREDKERIEIVLYFRNRTIAYRFYLPWPQSLMLPSPNKITLMLAKTNDIEIPEHCMRISWNPDCVELMEVRRA